MTTKPCPRCGRSSIISGRVAGLPRDQYFQPFGIRWVNHLLKRFGQSTDVRLPDPYLACLDCGLVWNDVLPDRLRALVEREGIPVGFEDQETEVEL